MSWCGTWDSPTVQGAGSRLSCYCLILRTTQLKPPRRSAVIQIRKETGTHSHHEMAPRRRSLEHLNVQDSHRASAERPARVISLTCRWCLSSATWASCGRSCNWPHLGRRSGAFSWSQRFGHRCLRSLAGRRTFAFSSACPWAPRGYICLPGIHKTCSDSAEGETRMKRVMVNSISVE